MRQRKAKDLDKRLQECSGYMAENPEPELWKELFGNENQLFLEIGCGKGNFIIKKAKDNPSNNYIAVEGQETVILRALEKAAAEDSISEEGVCSKRLTNVKFMLTFVHNMSDFFNENQLSGIYLNFSDPWPKARHAKRRLTYRKRLLDYGWALKPGGFIEIKTDNDDLFDFTLEEIKEVGYEIKEMTHDLHAGDWESKYTMTEYEEKFKSNGKNINYVKVIINK